jgi:glycerol-3-phosphate acyltransferase PlsY
MQATDLIYALFLSYLIGSIPFGLVLTKIFSKKSLQSHGSGNIGATNVVRVAGKKIGYLTFILDSSKGILAIFITQYLFTHPQFNYICGFFAVLGHIYPIWLKFSGGKGVATFIGVLLYYDPFITILFLLGWYITYYIVRIVSLASILLMVVITIFFLLYWAQESIIFIILSLLIILKHSDNIRRLVKGEEHSFKQK